MSFGGSLPVPSLALRFGQVGVETLDFAEMGRLSARPNHTLAVEQWLRSLSLAPKTRLNLRTIFHVIYTYGLRWNFTDRNPIALVRQSGGVS